MVMDLDLDQMRAYGMHVACGMWRSYISYIRWVWRYGLFPVLKAGWTVSVSQSPAVFLFLFTHVTHRRQRPPAATSRLN